jgi:hypothetical protein
MNGWNFILIFAAIAFAVWFVNAKNDCMDRVGLSESYCISHIFTYEDIDEDSPGLPPDIQVK